MCCNTDFVYKYWYTAISTLQYCFWTHLFEGPHFKMAHYSVKAKGKKKVLTQQILMAKTVHISVILPFTYMRIKYLILIFFVWKTEKSCFWQHLPKLCVSIWELTSLLFYISVTFLPVHYDTFFKDMQVTVKKSEPNVIQPKTLFLVTKNSVFPNCTRYTDSSL